jgi:SMI1/KNR4 family protein SUKH-1
LTEELSGSIILAAPRASLTAGPLAVTLRNRAVTDAEMARVEERLDLKFPASYVATLRKFAADRANISPSYSSHLTVLLTVPKELLDMNLKVRQAPRHPCRTPAELQAEWPRHLLVCGTYAKHRQHTYFVIDCQEKNPAVLQISKPWKKLEKCLDHPNLQALYRRARVQYRDLTAMFGDAARQKREERQEPRQFQNSKAVLMSEAEIARVEKELGIEFPKKYRTMIRGCSRALAKLPEPFRSRGPKWFLTDAQELLALNKAIRRSPGKFVTGPEEVRRKWPKHLLACGYDRNDEVLVFDCRQKNPDLLVLDAERGLAPSSLEDLVGPYMGFRAKMLNLEKKAREAPPTSPAPDLLAVGKSLAREAILLDIDGDTYAAVWRGHGVVPPPAGNWEHVISFDCAALPQNPRKLRGVISLYESHDRCDFDFRHDRTAKLPKTTDGTKLYGTAFESLPDIAVVLRHGPREVKEWAESRPPGYQKTAAAYNNANLDSDPFSNNRGYAMLGGWPPQLGYFDDEDWDRMMSRALLLFKTEDQPQIELWDDGKKMWLEPPRFS